MPAEYTFGALQGTRATSNLISRSNLSDTFAFSLNSTQSVDFSLNTVGNLTLFRASTINGVPEAIEPLAASTIGQFDRVLAPGNYIIEVANVSLNTRYTLQLATQPNQTSFNIGSFSGAQTYGGTVSDANPTDLYRIQLTTPSNLNLTLNGLSADADLRLALDRNRNGRLDAGEEIARSERYLNFSESIARSNLAAGDYLIEVKQFRGDTHYRLGVSATASARAQSSLDVTGAFTSVSAPDIRAINTSGQAQFNLTNLGDRLSGQQVRVNLYASTDETYDSNDELLGSQTISLNLLTGQSQIYNFNFGAPTAVAPGSYQLLARIDTTNVLSERNETNNLVTQHVSAPGTNVVHDWNATLLNAIQANRTAPPLAARNQAILHAAMFDAVNAIEQRYSVYQVSVTDSRRQNASSVAAAAQAAYQVLVDLYPNQRAIFEAQLQRTLAEVPDGVAEDVGIEIGQFVADRILANRLNDGAAGAQDRYQARTFPGAYQPTRVDEFVALPAWGKVTPFALRRVADFVPGGPPVFGSTQYAVELNQVQRLGDVNSRDRTADQSDIAVFWAYDREDTFRPPAQWNEIAARVSILEGTSVLETARLFAQLNIAQADAGMVAWEAKYTYHQLRPITAIRRADTDGNSQTVGDATWQSFLPTPPFPDYISGHSTFGAAAAGVLSAFFGRNYQFSATSQEIHGTYRTFNSFEAAAAENGLSRIYGGVHVLSADIDGLQVGYDVANYVTRNLMTAIV